MSAEIINFPRTSETADTSSAIDFWIALGRFALVLGKHDLAKTALDCAQRLNREHRCHE